MRFVALSMVIRIALLILLMLSCFGCLSQPERNGGSSPSAQASNPLSTPSPEASPAPRKEVSFADGLRIVPKNVNLENERWRYKIDVDYPQIEGSNDSSIRSLNMTIEKLVKKKYSWMLKSPTKKELGYYSKWPDVYNSVEIEYDVTLATDDLLSVYLTTYHYGIGAAHSVHESFSVNYDLKTHRLLALDDNFTRSSQYLQFISRRCIEELSKSNPMVSTDPSAKKLNAQSSNFESWNITPRGLRVNFDACRIASCAEGDLQVEIPFDELQSIIDVVGPLRSLSTRRG